MEYSTYDGEKEGQEGGSSLSVKGYVAAGSSWSQLLFHCDACDGGAGIEVWAAGGRTRSRVGIGGGKNGASKGAGEQRGLSNWDDSEVHRGGGVPPPRHEVGRKEAKRHKRGRPWEQRGISWPCGCPGRCCPGL